MGKTLEEDHLKRQYASSFLQSCCRTLHRVGKEQATLVALLMSDRRFRSPMIALWISDAGGALHAPMVMFFFMHLGAKPMDLGVFGFIMRGGAMILSPVYGRCVDQRGIRLPLLVCMSLCGTGCIIRGLAQNSIHLYVAQFLMGAGGGSAWSMVKGYIARNTDEDKRPLVVSGLRLQMLVLSLMKVFYPALDAALSYCFSLERQLSRYRAVITTCTVFCWAGVIVLTFWPPLEAAAVSPRVETAKEAAISSKTRLSIAFAFRFLLPATAFAVVGCASTICLSLWPLFLQSRFGWSATQYAFIMFADSAFTAGALSAYPHAAATGGGARLARMLVVFITCCLIVAYSIGANSHRGQAENVEAANEEVDPAEVGAHVTMALATSAALGVLGPCLETLTSLNASLELQGLVMGLLNTAMSLGALCGSLAGMALWSISLTCSPQSCGFFTSNAGRSLLPLTWPFREGRLPYAAVVFLLLFAGLLLEVDRRSNWSDDALPELRRLPELRGLRTLVNVLGLSFDDRPGYQETGKADADAEEVGLLELAPNRKASSAVVNSEPPEFESPLH